MQPIMWSGRLSSTHQEVLIYDRDGELLVINKAAYDLLITPREVASFDTTTLCNILKISKKDLEGEISKAKKYSNYKPSIIIKQISPETYAYLQEQLYKLPWVLHSAKDIEGIPKENSKPMSWVMLGEVGQQEIQDDNYYQIGDYTGISGIEKAYEKELRGEKGVKYFLVDVHNRLKGNYREGQVRCVCHPLERILLPPLTVTYRNMLSCC